MYSEIINRAFSSHMISLNSKCVLHMGLVYNSPLIGGVQRSYGAETLSSYAENLTVASRSDRWLIDE